MSPSQLGMSADVFMSKYASNPALDSLNLTSGSTDHLAFDVHGMFPS